MARTILACALALTGSTTTGFTMGRHRSIARSSISMEASTVEQQQPPQAFGRRALFGLTAAAAAQTVFAASPALAMSEDKYQARLKGYGLPPSPKVPDGYQPVLEVYGKAQAANNENKATTVLDPLVVSFNAPSSWLIQRPNIDVNGEDGTISAGDYGKGDSAALFVTEKKGNFDENSKQALAEIIFAGLTQKAAVIQNLKLKKVQKLEANTETPYYLVEYTYELITGAGFEVARKGNGSVTAVGKSVQAMITASTDIRYKKVEGQLKEIAQSFRVYDKVAL